MALADISLADGQGSPVTHVFSFQSAEKGRVIRTDLSKSPELPLDLTIGHQSAKKNGITVDSHLFRIDYAVLDGDNITIYRPNIRICGDVPVAIYSDALADDFAAFLRNWSTSANMRAFMRKSFF